MIALERKRLELQKLLRQMGSVLVTFSGGVDSTFLAKVAVDLLGDQAVALTAVSPSLAEAELADAKRLAGQIGIQHLFIESKELEDPRYGANPKNRCYFCKSELFSLAAQVAKEHGFNVVLDGMQADDLTDERPGRAAAREWTVRSPLAEVGLTKQEIRQMSRTMGLPTWDKPEMACLASRLPTGMAVTAERLSQVEACEANLKAEGFKQLRARHQGDAVRVELEPHQIEQLSDANLRDRLVKACHQAGFRRVWLDLAGYGRLS